MSSTPISRLVTVALVAAAVVAASTACTRREPSTAPAVTGVPGTIPGSAPGSAPGTTSVGVRPAVKPAGTVVDGSIRTPDGRERTYHLYVPSSLPAGRAVPLLVALHGGLGTGKQFQANSGFDGLAEANGFLVVFPDGIPIGALPGQVWNGGYCCGPAARLEVDDVGFISSLIDTIEGQYAVDKARVYAAGHSNGGIMSYRLACELSDKIVGVGVQSSSLGIDTCAPPKPVSLIHIHGTADTNHPIDGGVGDTGVSRVDFHPAIDGVRTIARVDGCPAEPAETVAGDLTTDLWSPCRQDTAVQFVKVAGANHAWMGHAPASAASERLVGKPYMGIDSSAEIWAFLAAHPRCERPDTARC